MRVYVGVDPGIKCSAVAAVSQSGRATCNKEIKEPAPWPGRDHVHRLAEMTNRIIDTIEEWHLGPETVYALESPIIGQFRTKKGVPTANQNALKTRDVFAVVAAYIYRMVQHQQAAKLLIVHPRTLKAFLGHGSMKKADVARAVKERWGFTHPSHDVVDAYALAQYARSQDS